MTLNMEDLKKLQLKAEAEESGEVLEEPAEEEAPPAEEEETPAEEEEAPPAEEEETPAEEEEETPAEDFVFDKKVKVLDSEIEIDDFIAANVKNEEQAKKVRELYEKASGLDHVKQKNERLQSKIDDIAPKFEADSKMLNYLDKMVANKDIDNILKVAKISEEEVLQHAANILRSRELTPEQRQAYNRDIDARNRAYVLELENASLRQGQTNESVQDHVQAFENVMGTPDVQQTQNIFDTRVGKPGAFKRAVIEYAAQVEQSTEGKTVLTPQQAVDQFVTQVKPLLGDLSQQAAPAPASAPAVQEKKSVVVDPRSKPVIPKIGGGSKSPVKKKPQSIDDLRKLAEEMETE